jgi:hypothetical protein
MFHLPAQPFLAIETGMFSLGKYPRWFSLNVYVNVAGCLFPQMTVNIFFSKTSVKRCHGRYVLSCFV